METGPRIAFRDRLPSRARCSVCDRADQGCLLHHGTLFCLFCLPVKGLPLWQQAEITVRRARRRRLEFAQVRAAQKKRVSPE